MFLILIAVALFAALGYAVTSSSQSSGSGVSQESAKLCASRILQFGSGVQQTIERMRISGNVPVYKLDFRTLIRKKFDGTTLLAANLSCPAAEESECGVYMNIPFQTFETCSITTTNNLMGGHNLAQIAPIEGVGTPNNDVVLRFQGIRPDVCAEINRAEGLPEEIYDWPAGAWQGMNGTITDTQLDGAGYQHWGLSTDPSAPVAGHQIFCVASAPAGQKFLFITAVVR